jgi:flagellar biosynthesis/type III secretory pathway protein FliH
MKNMSDIGYSSEDWQNINFIANEGMQRGNCRLETPLGLVNFDIERLLRDLEIKVLEA